MDASAYREEIYEVFAGSGADEGIMARVERALAVGTERLQLPIGLLTHIDDEVQEIVAATGDHERIELGERCPLDEAYCRRTVTADGPLAVQDAAASTMVDERAVDTFGLGTYIGATVGVDDEPYGTVDLDDLGERIERTAGELMDLSEQARELERNARRDGPTPRRSSTTRRSTCRRRESRRASRRSGGSVRVPNWSRRCRNSSRTRWRTTPTRSRGWN